MPRKTETGLEHTKTVKRGKIHYVYFNSGQKDERGKPVYIPLGRKDAVEFGARYSAALSARTRRAAVPKGLTVPRLVMAYERSPDYEKKSIGTQRTYSVYLRRLAKSFDTCPAGALEASDLYALMDSMAGRPAAIDMLLLAGGQMYRWGVKRKHVHANPFEEIDREDWDAAQYQPWPETLVTEALADPRLGMPVALLYYTAQRIGDVCRMRWDQIDGDTIHVRQQKTGKELVIPIHEKLAAMLKDAPQRGETILADDHGRPMKDQTIRWWIKEFGAKRGHDVVPHGLRKNAVNALLEADCSTGETSAISGQSLGMVEHYARKRDSRKMAKRAVAKWERSGNRETLGKTEPETAEK